MEKERELAISIIDEFEELLDKKNLTIQSDDREGRDEEARIYGSEYYQLEDSITQLLIQKYKEVKTMEESIHKHINENPDSLEIGTPSKGGAIKVYGDFGNKEDFKTKITNAMEVRQHAQAETEKNT